MKRYPHILTALFLSLLIIFMGAGIPVIQYRCASCADTSLALKQKLRMLSADTLQTEKPASATSCSCCTCRNPQSGFPACATTHIAKLSTPTLTMTLQGDELAIPCMDLLFSPEVWQTALTADGLSLQAISRTPIEAPPRIYLTRLCILLI